MANFTLKRVDLFPNGTTVEARKRSVFGNVDPARGVAPPGAAEATAVSDGTQIVFSGLANSTEYVFSAQVATVWQHTSTLTSAAPSAGAATTTVEDVIAALTPASLWKLGEKSGAFADSGSGGKAGTYVSGTRYQRGHRPGSKAVWNAADTAIATFGDNYRFTGNAPFTVLALHYPTAFSGGNISVCEKRDTGNTMGWALGYNASSPWIQRTGAGAVTADVAANVNEWNLIIATYDGTTLGIYCNGVNKTLADSGALAGNAQALQMGNFAGGGAFAAHGRYDTVAIWNRALSVAEMDSIWDLV